MCSGRDDGQLRPPGFPIRKSSDHSLVAGSPRLIAGSNVLHRLLVPRHPPCALINLATTIDARVHCAVLKIRAAPRQNPTASAVRSHGPRKQNARSLRTQQRARPAPRRRRRPAPRKGRTGLTLPGTQANNQTSTDELPPRDIRPGHGSGRGPRQGDAPGAP
jgi:hypothetical protein